MANTNSLPLTLRTLLAYRDGQLPQALAGQIRSRVAAQPRLSELLGRIGRAVGRPMLDAPRPRTRRPHLDANRVAAWLDMTLPESDVAAFEQSCLLSDTLLAEVAAGHRTLVRILSGPLQVSDDTRRRMHGLAKEVQREAEAGKEKFTWLDADGNFIMIRFHCASCSGLLSVHRRRIGRRVTCPKCQARVTVPESDALAHSGRQPAAANQPTAATPAAAASSLPAPIESTATRSAPTVFESDPLLDDASWWNV